MAQGLDRPVVDPDLLKPRMRGEYPVHPVGEERGAESPGFYAGIVDEEGFRLRVPGEEIMRERRDIDKKYLRGKPVDRRPPAHDHVIAPTPHQKLVDGFRYRLAIEVDHYVHASLLSSLLGSSKNRAGRSLS